ncbi:hypothetical protein MNBD_PLANCTO03-2166 [hydrothermal vent metagenome]|uniref:Uncharacterized protein n=1 Tax=hydrothermal vent metagenome TaxID=652676 RepID=A0A3B1E6J3_9ZZZZ
MPDEQTPFEPTEFPDAEAPPTQAGDFVPVTPPEGWPTVIGVLSIIFGGLGVVGAGCGAIVMLAFPALINLMPEGPEREELEKSIGQGLHYVPLQIGSQLIEFVLAVILIVGGVQLLKRSRGAVKSLTVFAIGDLISNTLVLILGIMTAQAQAKMMAENPEMQQVPQGAQGMMEALGVIGAVVTWVLSAIWPIFLLLWFRRAKIRASVESWGGGGKSHDPSYTVR